MALQANEQGRSIHVVRCMCSPWVLQAFWILADAMWTHCNEILHALLLDAKTIWEPMIDAQIVRLLYGYTI